MVGFLDLSENTAKKVHLKTSHKLISTETLKTEGVSNIHAQTEDLSSMQDIL